MSEKKVAPTVVYDRETGEVLVRSTIDVREICASDPQRYATAPWPPDEAEDEAPPAPRRRGGRQKTEAPTEE